MIRSTSRQMAVLIALALIGLSACTTATPTPAPRSNAPGSTQGQAISASPGPGGGATPAPGDETAHALPCGDAEAAAGDPTPYVAELPEPPVAVGAGGEEEQELNDGVVPPLPIDPDAVLPDDSGIQQPVIPIPGAQDDPQPDDIIVYSHANHTESASHVAEPNVAVNGQSSLMTWNWGAARSFDGGATVNYMDPQHELGSATSADRVDGGFCCDQLAHYVASHNMWLWVMQTQTVNQLADSGGNRIRVKVALGDGPFDRYFDFRSADSGLPGDVWYDQPKIGTSNGHMTLSINAFLPVAQGKAFVASVIYRVALDDLAAGRTATPDCFSTYDPSNRSLPSVVPVRNAGDVMYLVAHASNVALTVWRWPDGAALPVAYEVVEHDAQGQNVGYPYPTRTDSEGSVWADYKCPQADGVGADWCQGTDARISSAFMANGQIGIAWNVGQSPTDDESTNWPYPSVFVELIDEARLATCALTGCVAGRLNVRNKQTSFQYAAIAPNARGDLGMVALLGGGTLRPSCAFFIHRAGSNGWETSIEAYISSREAVLTEWGHYLGIWPGPTDSSWAAACMTIDGVDDQNTAKLHFVTFGRRSDQPAQ